MLISHLSQCHRLQHQAWCKTMSLLSLFASIVEFLCPLVLRSSGPATTSPCAGLRACRAAAALRDVDLTPADVKSQEGALGYF